MKKVLFISLIIVINLNLVVAQSKSEINSLLNGISTVENSKDITKTEQAKIILSFGQSSLLALADFFTDSTLTKVESKCQEFYLTKGEIAIIMADRIEFMPYVKLTGIQNCLLNFCEDNPNLVEYYLGAIRRDGTGDFQRKYVEWLNSDEHDNYQPYFQRITEKETEKIERQKMRKEDRKKRRAKQTN